MKELFRDTAFGQILRFLSAGKILPFPDQYDSNTLEKYMSTASRPAVLPNVPGPDSASTSSNERDSIDMIKDAEKGVPDYELIDWLPNDPENPQNWSLGKKLFVSFEICLLTLSVYIGSAIYTTGLAGVEEHFHVSSTVALLGLTMFVLGYGIGPMVWSPLQEIPVFGKSPIYLITLLIFVGLQPAVIYSPNIGALLVFRFLTGFFGSPVLATGGASLGDMFSPKKRAYAISIWGISAVLGPVLGPVVGGFAAEFENWQWPIWELMWLSGFCLIFLFFFLPETSGQNILYRRAVRIRKARGQDGIKVKTQDEVIAEGKKATDIVYRAVVRPFVFTFTEPVVLAFNMYIGLIYAILYLWFESFPIVFQGMYGFTTGTLGLAYIGLLVGALLTLPPYVWYMRKYLEPKFGPHGELAPEMRLPTACVAGFFLPVCMFWFGWSAGRTHWIVPIIGTAFFSPGAFLMFNGVLNYLGDAFPMYAASVYASNTLFRSAFASAFPLFANAMYAKLGIDWANSLLGFLTILFIPIPFVLYRYGGKLRLMSKTARHDMQMW